MIEASFFMGLCWHSIQPTVLIASVNQPAIPSDGDGLHVATGRTEKGPHAQTELTQGFVNPLTI